MSESSQYSYEDLSTLSLDEMLELQASEVEISSFKLPPQAIYTAIMGTPEIKRSDDGKTGRYVIDFTPSGVEEALNLKGNEAFVEAVASGDTDAVAKLMPEKIQQSYFLPTGISNIIRDFSPMLDEEVLASGSNAAILDAIKEMAGAELRFKVTHYVKKKAGEEDKTYVNFKNFSINEVDEEAAE